MEYGHFIKILEGENLNRKATGDQLKEIIQQYPYFQTAHILLAKALHEQNNIDFDRALKLAAVYSGDRALLFDYINKKQASQTQATEEVMEEPLVEVEKEEPQPKIFETKIPELVAIPPTFIKKEEPYTEYFSEEEILGIEDEEPKEEKVYDPHDLIRKRLSEILGTTEPVEEVRLEIQKSGKPVEEISVQTKIKAEEKEELKSQSIEINATTPIVTLPESPKEEIISREAEKATDPLSRMEVEYAMEASILEALEMLPLFPQKEKDKPIPQLKSGPKIEKDEEKKTTTADADTTSSFHSFTDWLRAVSPKPFHNYSEVHSTTEVRKVEVEVPSLSEEELIEPASSEEELIDKFIAAEPKIVPSKTEFYSPINQAKKSLMEHDDVVSETLAKIYKDQGNLVKARWCYERLMLVHPEKSSFFAALLKEIDDINKEDL